LALRIVGGVEVLAWLVQKVGIIVSHAMKPAFKSFNSASAARAWIFRGVDL